MEYLRNILKVENANGEAWGNLGKPLIDYLQKIFPATHHIQVTAT